MELAVRRNVESEKILWLMNNTCLVCDQEAKTHCRLTEVTSDFVIFMCLIQLLRSLSTFLLVPQKKKGKKQKRKEAFAIQSPVEKPKKGGKTWKKKMQICRS